MKLVDYGDFQNSRVKKNFKKLKNHNYYFNTFGRTFVSVKIVFGEFQYIVVIILQRIDVHFLLYIFHFLQLLFHPEFPPLIPFGILDESVIVLPVRGL